MPDRAVVFSLVLFVVAPGACSRRAALPEITKTNAIDADSRPTWPKSGRISGTEAELKKLLTIPGVTTDDHGQQKLGPGRWRVTVNVADQKAVEDLRRNGFEPALEDPIIADPGSR